MHKGYSISRAILFLMLLCTLPSAMLLAQRYIDVPAGYGTLSTIVTADSANRAANPNTIYRVHRGSTDSVYYLTSTLTSSGTSPLQIQSVGTGPLPRFIMATLGDGSAISPIISAKANFVLKGVIIDGYNTLGVPIDRAIRIQANAVSVTLDSCQFNMSTQSFIRVDNTNAKIFLKNCRVSNVFSDWANARGIDNRGVTIDTLSVVGCTFSRIGQRIYRDGGGILTYGFFNHNTFVDIANGLLSLGTTKNFVYTNNFTMNGQFLGQGISSAGRQISITSASVQSAYIANNIFYADSASLTAAFHTSSDTVVFAQWFADTLVAIAQSAGTYATNISSPVTFVLPPGNATNAVKVDSIARWFWRNPTDVSRTTDASILRVDSISQVSMAYNTNAPAYTYATDGKPVGSTEWFGISPTSVERLESSGIPEGFALYPNYPNPFNPSTMVTYSLAKSGTVRLAVYDVVGRVVRTLVEEEQIAGSYRTVFDAQGFSSGVYFCRLTVNGAAVGIQKMLLMK